MKILLTEKPSENGYNQSLINAYTRAGHELTTGADAFFFSESLPDMVHIHWPESLFRWHAPRGMDSEQVSRLITERLGVYSPDGTLVAYPDRETGLAVIERVADGQQWEFDTQGRGLRFTPDSQHVIWTTYDEDAPRDTREETLWLAKLDGSDARVLLRARRRPGDRR